MGGRQHIGHSGRLFALAAGIALPWIGLCVYEHASTPVSQDAAHALYFLFAVYDLLMLALLWKASREPFYSLANIVRDPRVALMFLIPGSGTTMRVNGRAVVRVDEAITQRFVMDGRHPRSVVVVSVQAVYPQCARAVLRADLWNPEKFRDPSLLPTVGQMLASVRKDFDGGVYDREWPGRAAKTMW